MTEVGIGLAKEQRLRRNPLIEQKNTLYKRDFLQTNADYYGASIYKAAFDNATLKDINGWVSDKTDGMIEDILDKIPDAASCTSLTLWPSTPSGAFVRKCPYAILVLRRGILSCLPFPP